MQPDRRLCRTNLHVFPLFNALQHAEPCFKRPETAFTAFQRFSAVVIGQNAQNGLKPC
jgi:hypothetical protein